jgi:hypothetical protein
VFDCFLDFKSGDIPLYIWLESRIIPLLTGGTAREREREEREREQSGSVDIFSRAK